MLSPPLLDFGFADLPQLVDLGGFSREDALDHLDSSADHVLPADGVRDGRGLDLDDADPRVLVAAVVLPVAQVAEPGLEGGAVVFLDHAAIGDDLRRAGDRGPLARAVEEGDVGARVGRDVVRLAGLGVGVEDQIDAAGFL